MSQSEQANLWLIIPCAGVGSRVGADIPKQYLALNNSTVLEQTLQCFLSRDDVSAIVLAVADNDRWVRELALIKANAQRIFFAEGGVERSDSVMSALQYLQNEFPVKPCDLVAIHDAARPCVSQVDLDAVFSAASQSGAGALLAVPSFNTLKKAISSENSCSIVAEKTLDRRSIWQAYTPQVFSFQLIQSALQKALEKAVPITDDASAVELLGETPVLVEGSASNIKITQRDDLALAEFYLSQADKA